MTCPSRTRRIVSPPRRQPQRRQETVDPRTARLIANVSNFNRHAQRVVRRRTFHRFILACWDHQRHHISDREYIIRCITTFRHHRDLIAMFAQFIAPYSITFRRREVILHQANGPEHVIFLGRRDRRRASSGNEEEQNPQD